VDVEEILRNPGSFGKRLRERRCGGKALRKKGKSLKQFNVVMKMEALLR